MLAGIRSLLRSLARRGQMEQEMAIESLLFEVKPQDPAAFATAAAVLLTSAGLAGWWPARRASRIAPMEALRHE